MARPLFFPSTLSICSYSPHFDKLKTRPVVVFEKPCPNILCRDWLGTPCQDWWLLEKDGLSRKFCTVPEQESETPFERFKRLTVRVISVPRAEIQKRELKWKNGRKK